LEEHGEKILEEDQKRHEASAMQIKTDLMGYVWMILSGKSSEGVTKEAGEKKEGGGAMKE
jgi:hypothetical protein